MNFSAIKNSYSLWMQIKCLHNSIKYAECIYDFNSSDENDETLTQFWDSITTKVKIIIENLMNGEVLFAIFDQSLNEDTINQEKIWANLEFLLDNLFQLLVAKDYNCIRDFDTFFNNVNDLLSFFEIQLKTYLLRKLSEL